MTGYMLDLYSSRADLSKLFSCKGLDSKYFRLCNPYSLYQNSSTSLCSVKAAIDNM